MTEGNWEDAHVSALLLLSSDVMQGKKQGTGIVRGDAEISRSTWLLSSEDNRSGAVLHVSQDVLVLVRHVVRS